MHHKDPPPHTHTQTLALKAERGRIMQSNGRLGCDYVVWCAREQVGNIGTCTESRYTMSCGHHACCVSSYSLITCTTCYCGRKCFHGIEPSPVNCQQTKLPVWSMICCCNIDRGRVQGYGWDGEVVVGSDSAGIKVHSAGWGFQVREHLANSQ